MVLGFDKPFAHPTSSFNAPVVPPDSDPTDGEQVTVCFSLAWLPFVLGAMSQLQLQSTWKTDNADDTLLAQNRATDLIDQFNTPTCPTDTIDAPFWDDSEDVDDELPITEQPWYGVVSDPEAPPAELDFVENALIWALTGFLAVATWEIGAAPAILFHTIAPRFVLASRRGDLGEIIRIIVDGEEVARVDTSSASPGDVIETPILTDPTIETGHDIMIVQVS